ncbi:MAG: glycosyltransferase family 39 protein [Candidatus Omnitrophica bacterium]|nr:glycosyltransferase family 39 protein [Candidatus Omnitrophota bacterium]
MNFSKTKILVLIVVCAANLLLLLPTMGNNVDNPNLITYFSGDEGYTMDVLWFYYSGEKRESYQGDVDYGIEWFYVSRFARLILSKFIDFGPGTLILLLKWIHLIAWIGALIALWFFVGYHFGKGWQQIVAVLLLATRPSLDYVFNSAKPEPLVLLIMLLGFHFVLRIIEKPSIKYFLFSILCVVTAFAIKFAGIFLLPAIIAAMYYSKQYQNDLGRKNYIGPFPKFKHNWIFEFLIGIFFITIPFLFIFSYVRKSTGLTFYNEFGILGSLAKNKISFLAFFTGAVFLFISAILFFLNKSRKFSNKKITETINEINSYALLSGGLFFIFLLLIEFKWILSSPDLFRTTYFYNISDFIGVFATRTVTVSNILGRYSGIVISKIKGFDPIILLLFGIYLIVELRLRKQKSNIERRSFYKRLSLDFMLIPIFIAIFTMGRFTHHHMLPFFCVASILAIKGVDMFRTAFKGPRLIKMAFLFFVSILFTISIVTHGAELIKLRLYQYRQREDVVFEIEKWWRQNVPLDETVVADHHSMVYMPPEYKNVTFIKISHDKIEQIKDLVRTVKPKYVYYNSGHDEKHIVPPIESVLPDLKVKLVASFNSVGRLYRRLPNSQFLIYEVISYDKTSKIDDVELYLKTGDI